MLLKQSPKSNASVEKTFHLAILPVENIIGAGIGVKINRLPP